jgi:hypothetical protein
VVVLEEIVMNRDFRQSHAIAGVPTGALAAALMATLVAFAAPAAAQPDAAPTDRAEASDNEPGSRVSERRPADRAQHAETDAAAETPAESEPETNATRTAEIDADDVIVCRNQQVIGTKIKRRVCATAGQWAAMQRRTANAAEEGFRQLRERSTIVSDAPSGPSPSGGN